MAREVLALLQGVAVPVCYIRGNCDREVLARISGEETPWYRAARGAWRAPVEWTAEQLGRSCAAVLADWPSTLYLDVACLGRVLFCHASPQNDTDCFTSRTPDTRLRQLLAGIDAAAVVCGHTHMQFDRRVDDIRVINAGSVGMPFGDPGAYWLLLGSAVELRRTAYDFAQAAARIRATTYPQADEFAARNVLKPPSEDEMLEIFSRREE